MNKYRRNRHLAIRNIQRTDWFGRMTYRKARRKYKAGHRAIPVGSGYFTMWFLLNFGTDVLTLAQSRKLGEEYTRISEHVENVQCTVTMSYDIDTRCFKFRYSWSGKVWQFGLSFEEAMLLVDCGRLAECITRSAETDIPNLVRYDFVKVSKESIMAYASEGISDNDIAELTRIRDRTEYRSALFPIFAGYGITQVDKKEESCIDAL